MQHTFNHLIKCKKFKSYLFWMPEIFSSKTIIWRQENLSLSVAPSSISTATITHSIMKVITQL